MINIDYDLQNHLAKITCTDETIEYKWNRVRRLVEDNARISDVVSLSEVTLPWWCFLNLRSELVKTFRINDLTIEISDSVRKLLEKAQAHEKEYIKKREEYPTHKICQELKKKGFTRKLTVHQLRNVKVLLNYPAAATFSVPGAGKTTEALAYFALKKGERDRLLVVSPRNAFSTWEEELSNCLPNSGLTITRLQGRDDAKYNLERDFDIFLITYQQFYRVQNEIAHCLLKNDFFMFLDESHRIKRGYSGVYGSSILSICHLAKYKLVMSGTPLPNSVDDLIPQFTFLYPEIPITTEDAIGKFQPLYVRTTKMELGIKPPIRKLWTFEMKPAQRTLYDNTISEIRRSLEGMSLNDRTLFNQISKSIVRLMQINTDPSLLVDTELGQNELLIAAINEGPPTKIEEACHLARNLAYSGQKSIIWAQFVDSVENIADLLSDLNAQYIHGGIETDEDEENAESRESIIKRFHDDPACFVLVANPAACAEGISLHKVCHHAIYVDRNYNAAHYLQSEDRIHRLGLDPNQDTFIHILSCKGSIDDAIAQRLELKIARMGQVLNDTELTIEPIETIDESNGLSFEDVVAFKALIMGEGKDV